MTIKRILVINAKGGCGKTTITTNIASHYAQQGLNVRLFDHDTQGSSLAWINRRPDNLNQIHGVDASKNQGHRLTRSWKLRVPPETDVAIIDTPAGVDILELASLFQTNDSILIPVLPSPIDIHATAHFIKKLLTTGQARKKMIRIAVVANRVRKNTIVYHALERFLFSLKIPFVSSLRDTQLYTRAIELGVGVQEINSPRSKVDKEQWAPIVRWLEATVSDESSESDQNDDVRPLLTQQEN
ncbi:MAG: chromosome partitioning protein [Gammaproteobacteria bacterium]|jgi:chromosome partitioning protein